MGSRTPVFPLSNGLNPSFMPTQQRPNRVLTESLADQFHLIRQLTFQKQVLASQFLFARYFLRLARQVVPLYWHCLVVVAFDASFHQLDQVPGVLLSLFANSQISEYIAGGGLTISQNLGVLVSSLALYVIVFLDKLFLIFNLKLLLLGIRQEWLCFLFCVSYRFLFILTIFWL
ncbi:Hypothetical_protein [Hexamita inflata]|uniref:Hypothetical_protein n=1 Tax=Hexamita inflata TaxID=28002 RepID=A0AA86RH64_9EUKA|nr:Hypothetical protein HINF_LOCUS59694 [Hexamita inflata]